MKVGVLLCDHLDDEVAATHEDYEPRYRALLEPSGVHVGVYDLTRGELPTSTGECDAWLVGGSRLSAHTEEAFIPDLVEFCAAAAHDGVRQVGICFGHQVIARSLGGTVERAEGWGMGLRSYDLVHGGLPGWTEGGRNRFTIVASHRDQVTDLPADATLVATAAYCPVAAYRMEDQVLCVQGHPEFDVGLSATLSERRRELAGEGVTDAALASLGGTDEGPVVGGWIRNFLQRSPRHR